MPGLHERTPHLKELGEFFKTHRAALTPETVGLPTTLGQRRVAGLRREEVAQLINISSDYYTRIEQGRLAPSAPVLDSLIDALQLDTDQGDYARSLISYASRPATLTPAHSRKKTPRARIRPQLQRVLDQLPETPALVFGPRMDVLGWNELAQRLYVDFDALAPHERNYVRLIFTHPPMRDLFEDWPAVARSCVAILRREAVSNPADPQLSALVGELTIADRQFGHWWAARNVARQDFGTKTMHHPLVGELTLDWDMFTYAGEPSQQLVLNSAEPGSTSAVRLRQLAEHSTRGAS